MTVVMEQYEAEVKHPVRGLLLGDMLRTTLIQVWETVEDKDKALIELGSELEVVGTKAVRKRPVAPGEAGTVSLKCVCRRNRHTPSLSPHPSRFLSLGHRRFKKAKLTCRLP